MSFLAPGFLLAAAAGAIGIVALHLIVTMRPRAVAFPTARFVPDTPVAARARAVQLSDLVLLAVRLLTILAAGAALARPVFPATRERVVRVIAADVSGSVASLAETRDSVRALFRRGDALVVFDTVAWSVSAPDSVAPRGAPVARGGSLSAGLVAALRAGASVRHGADSIELVVVSPVTTVERDRATPLIRAQWPGRARVVRTAAASAPDSHAAGARQVEFLSGARPRFSVRRNRVDTAGAVTAAGNVLVAPFERRWRFVSDSMRGARVVARWADGEPAAVERDSAPTCALSVAIPIDSTGDMVLRPSFLHLRAALAAACELAPSSPDSKTATMLAGTGTLAPAARFAGDWNIGSPLARWLAVIAIALAIAEMVLRRERGPGLIE